MPIIYRPVKFEIRNIVRRQGIREYYKTKPGIKELIRELITSLETRYKIRGSVIYDFFPVHSIDRHTVSVNENITLSGGALNILSGANEIAIVICTVGDKMEKMVSLYFSQKKALKGLLLDGIASAAVDSLSQQACKIIAEQALSRGLQSGSPISPGMPGFDISEQKKLFNLVQADKIGVHLLSSGIMRPRKSVSMVIGIGTDMTLLTPAQICRRCPIKKSCSHRIY